MSLKRLTGSLFASDDATSREGQTEEATLPQQSGVNNVYQQGTSGGQGSIFTPAGPDVGLEAALKPLMEGNFAHGQPQQAQNPQQMHVQSPHTGNLGARLNGQQSGGQQTGTLPTGTAPFGTATPGTVPFSSVPQGTGPFAVPHNGNVAPFPVPPQGGQGGIAPFPVARGAGTGVLLPPVPQQLVHALVQRIVSGLPTNIQLEKNPDIEQMLAGRFMAALPQVSGNIPAGSQEALFEAVMDEILGFGPLEPLLKDDSISEIMVNGPDQVWVERKGQLIESGITFQNDDHVMRIAQRIVAPLGRRIDRKWPMVDARLPDGSRVNIIAQPCAMQGTTITIRKFFKTPLTVDNLIQFGTLTPKMAGFLRMCVLGRLNMVVAGGTGSGKTTLLNVLSSFIPEGERIVTIENSAELRLNQRHVVSLEARPADVDNAGAVTIRHLVTNSLRMRPERIIVGEVRSGEALDMLQAMNTGHDGSLTTLHANTPRDALSRMETMVLMSGMDLPIKVIREQVASAIDVIVQQSRLRDGSRKVVYITEVQGMEGDTIVLQDIFRWQESGNDEQGKIKGMLKPTGLLPSSSHAWKITGKR